MEKAPDFCLPGIDENGNEKEFCLKDFKGKKVVLYFYPKDDTPGCTKEACSFQENLNPIKAMGVEVIGVSPDSIASHKKFKEKYGLNFILLSDPDKKVAESYGAYGEKKMYGKVTKGIIRSTFVINENGEIEKAWKNVKVDGHVQAVIDYLKSQKA
ncbi:MAG: thioredoxin-dependent thiol peroxidase [Hydrogenobaculum sp.]|nr:MAG: thioredoxin-dependent thiol peroxidase [Hydrogenobaculum sp.]